MPTLQARKLTWKRIRPLLPPPLRQPPLILAIPPDPDDECEALCAQYEREQALLADGETGQGCDGSDGPLASGGCRW
jgi:hypothetical protein